MTHALFAFFRKIPRTTILHALIVIFYTVGWVGMVFFDTQKMAALTPLNLLITLGIMIYSGKESGKPFLWFFVLSFAIGMITEMIGVNTGYLFGDYNYGANLGPKIVGVPFLIGVNWFVTMYCASEVIHLFRLNFWVKVALSALLAVVLDFFLEQVAGKLDFWYWKGDIIPVYNYICWYGISFLILGIQANYFPVRRNISAVFLFGVQVLFFMSLSLIL